MLEDLGIPNCMGAARAVRNTTSDAAVGPGGIWGEMEMGDDGGRGREKTVVGTHEGQWSNRTCVKSIDEDGSE